MSFSRTNPSSRYIELQTMYRQLHVKGEEFMGHPPEQTFPGYSLDSQVERIREMIVRTGADSILDYGCGKGKQYEPRPIRSKAGETWPSVIDYWDVGEITCYDPCYEPYSKLPQGHFDGVICTDVLEHCPEEDLPWIVEELFSYAMRFVFANVACYPAKKRLPNGENAHCTIKSPDWWSTLLRGVAARPPGVAWEFWLQWKDEAEGRFVDRKLSGT